MKSILYVFVCAVVACQANHDRFIRDSSAFPNGYVGHWEVVLPSSGPQVFQAGVSVVPSGDSLLWQYFSRIVDTTTNQKIPCGPEMDFMPMWWDDSLQLAQADHGVGQGFGYDFLRLTSADRLQMNSTSLAPDCRGPFGINTSQLIFSRVDFFRHKP